MRALPALATIVILSAIAWSLSDIGLSWPVSAAIAVAAAAALAWLWASGVFKS